MRVTSRGLISEVNHSERQRESPGWKISEREERHSQRKMRRWVIKRHKGLDRRWKMSKMNLQKLAFSGTAGINSYCRGEIVKNAAGETAR